MVTLIREMASLRSFRLAIVSSESLSAEKMESILPAISITFADCALSAYTIAKSRSRNDS